MYGRKGKKSGGYIGGILGRGTCRGYREYSGDPVAPCTVCRVHTEDGAKRDFSFLFGKSAVLVPRPHQNISNF